MASPGVIRAAITDPVRRDMLRRTNNVANRAKVLAPVDKGTLRSRIRAEVRSEPEGPVGFVISDAPHSLAVHDGTGIYGPKGRPIRPRTKSVLRFPVKGGGIVYARQVRGMRGRPFLRDALPAALD